MSNLDKAQEFEGFIQDPALVPLRVRLGLGSSPRVTAICAEPGTCSPELLTFIQRHYYVRGHRIVEREYSTFTPEAATRSLVETARRASTAKRPVLVSIEGLPPADEAQVARQVRAINRMLSAGSSVVFTICPEARQIVDAIPDCEFITAEDLLVREVSDAAYGERFYELKGLTRGIPSLVKHLLPVADHLRDFGGSLPVTYRESLSQMIISSLRGSLTLAERKMRLAMILLGSGSCREVSDIVGRDSLELMAALRYCAPVFGVGGRNDTFRVLLPESRGDLANLLMHLTPLCSELGQVTEGCVRRLCDRGDYARAALICSVPGLCINHKLALEYGAAFLDLGEDLLVKRGIELQGVFMGPDDLVGVTNALVEARESLLCITKYAIGTNKVATELSSAGTSARDALLITEARRLLYGAQPLDIEPDERWPEHSLRLQAHIRAFGHLSEGRYTAALRHLTSCAQKRAEGTVSSALLAIDEAVACLLTGDSMPRRDILTERERGLLRGGAARGLSSYLGIYEVAGLLMRGSWENWPVVDGILARMERRGEELAVSMALVFAVLFDLGRGAVSKAWARSHLLRGTARKCGSAWCGHMAELLEAMTNYLLGREVGTRLSETVAPTDPLHAVFVLVELAISADPDAVLREVLDGEEVPRDALWLLVLLCEDMGELSAQIELCVPATWKGELEAAREHWQMERSGGEDMLVFDPQLKRRDCPASALRAIDVPVEVRFLGDFGVRVCGTEVPSSELERRDAESVLEYLVLNRAGSTKRHALVEQVWPGSEYDAGFMKAYRALGVIRRLVGEISPGLDPFVASRTTRRISVNWALIGCDVDEFTRCAKESCDSADDERALLLARRAEVLYRGDLHIPPKDATGYIASLRSTLRCLYADTMVAGADAALRLGQRSTAQRLASNALVADDMREDAVIILVQALRASGRVVEAERQYKNFVRRLERLSGAKPSERLMSVAGLGGEKGVL